MVLKEYWNLGVNRYDRVFVITLQKAPENRLNVKFAQEIIRALRDIEQELGANSEGCVVLKGNDEKFWCTGLDLDEADSNPFANSDGFFPVGSQLTLRSNKTSDCAALLGGLGHPKPAQLKSRKYLD